MARASSSSTKFASVNLNKSYGKPAASQGAQLPGSGGSRSRIASHGGMLLLTRPVRSQPAAAPAVLQKGAKLTVPLPVNLPSLRREHAGNDPNIALVGGTGASGWPKQQQKEAEEVVSSPSPVQVPVQAESNAAVSRSTPALTAGSTWGTSQSPPVGPPSLNPAAANFAPVNGELRPSSSPQMVARSGVYTPPRARTIPIKVNAVSPPRLVAVEKAVVLRGEDFPTLQAALPPAPPLPQHRQKELQQKQREKQQELKDQHQKLQLLSQKPPGDEQLQPQVVPPQFQPSQPVSLQPKREHPSQTLSNESRLSLEPQAVGQAGSRPVFKAEGLSSYGPSPMVRVNQRSNWTDDEREPAQSLRPQGGQGQYSEWPDRPDRENFLEDPRRNSRSEDYGFGRQLSHRENPSSFGTGIREGGFGRDLDTGRDGGFGADGYARAGNFNSSYNLTNNHNREERYGREGLGSRDGFSGREGGYPVEKVHGKDGGYNRESGMGRDGGFGREGGYGRQGAFGRDGGGAGRDFVPGRDNNLDRDGFGRVGVSRDFTHDREGYFFRDGFGKEIGPRESFYKESSFGRDSNFNRDGSHGRDNRRPQGGDYEGGRGRYGGDRFGRSGAGRFHAGSDFSDTKGGPFASGRGIMGLDSGLDFNRERRFGVPYSEDAFAKDFPDLPGLDFRASAGLGEILSSVESKLIRRKKEEAKVSAFYDSEREAFEAELERVQKLQEQERLRKLEEKERAIEQARKEHEEQERLAREEVERQLKLEEEAREAAARAEQEALEAARKVEEEKKAREEEKRSLQVEEERRKENARRKLLELEERIAKREAEKKQKVEEALMPEEDRLRNQRQVQEYEVAIGREVVAREEDERIVASLTGADQDDDDRAPLRPSRRPASPPVPRSQEEFSSGVKSPDVQNIGPAGRRMPDLRGGNAFEADRSRSFMSWRRDVTDNGTGSSQNSLYGREEASEFQFSMPRDRIFPGRREYTERDAFYGGSIGVLTSDGGPADQPARREDRVQGYQEGRWPADESGSSNKRSASPRATTPDSDGGYLESFYDRDGDRHWGRDKQDRQRYREGKRPSPPPPSSYLQGTDAVESITYGRLRQSLAKQPRVPPPPLRAPLHRPPLKSARDMANSSPSPLLHPGSEDIRGPSWQEDGPPENHSVYASRSMSRSRPSDSSMTANKQPESGQRETVASLPEKSQVRELQRLSASLRPQRSYLQSARGSLSESQDESSDQPVTGVEKYPPVPRDNSLIAATDGGHVDEEDSDEEVSPSVQRRGELKSEVDEADSTEDEDDGDGDEEEEYVDEVELDDNVDLDDDADLDEDVDLDDEVDLDNEVDLDDAVDHDDEADLDDEEVAGEWEDDFDLDGENDERVEEPRSVGFNGEYDLGNLNDKEERESEIDYKDYEQSGRQDRDEVSVFKREYDREVESKEIATQDSVDVRQQEKDMLHHSVPKPFLQHATLAPSVPLASVIPLQTVQGENYIPQVQQPLSFMAVSLPQSHTASMASQVPSLVASLPVLQNSQEGPVTFQFGLLSSTSLLPPSVPAIQIGSIQMPLHLHPQSGPQIHGSQTPLFQFGQLGHQTPMPSIARSFPASQSLVHQLSANAGSSQLNETSVQESHVNELQGKDPFTQGEQLSLQSSKSTWPSQPGENALGDFNFTDADAPEIRNGGRPGFRPDSRGRDRSSRDVLSAPHVKGLQRGGSEGALESSSSEISVATPVDSSFDNNQGGDSSWNRPYAGGRGRGATRWPGPPSRGRGRTGSYGGRGVLQGTSDGSASYSTEAGIDGAVRTRPSRRSSYRRTEFKVRDSTLPSERTFPDSLASKQASGREKYSHQSGWLDTSSASGNMSDGSVSRDGHRDSASHYHDRKYYGDPGQNSHSIVGGRSAQSSASKIDRSGNSDAPLKNGGRGSGYGGSLRLAEGLLGRYSPEMTSDVSLLDQPGIEGLSDDDDFIEVRSKRQMLNDRREQKEKEMKAKTKDLKAKEQAARKQRLPMKAGFQGSESGVGTGSKSSGQAGPEKRSSIQGVTLEASNSSTSRLSQSAISSTGVSSASVPVSNTPAQLLPPIGTPAGSTDTGYEKRSKNAKPRITSASGGSVADGDLPASSAYDNQDSISSATLAWGGTRSTLQVVSLTQIQLEEAMKPVRFETPVSQQHPFGERSTLLEPVASVSSASGKDKTSASPSGPVGSLLAGEKIQFGAVTSPPIPLASSRPLTPGLNAVVGSSLGARADGASDENELKSKSKRLPGAGNEVSPFTGKTKRTRGDEDRGGDGGDAEAEAEAAASAVAVAAISSDESVGSTHHGDGQNLPLRGVGLPGSGNKNSFGKSPASSLHRISMGDGNTSSVMIQGSALEESMSVALPADLSVEPTSLSLQGPASNSDGLLLQSLPGGPLPYRGLEMGSMLGGPIFGFGTNKDASQGPQGTASTAVHDQGIATAGSGSGGWQPQHSGGVDSYYGGPPSSYPTGPFINPSGGIPSIQGSPHMLVYTNPFASVSQFGQLGVSFVSPQQYMASGKQPDWKHTPIPTSSVGMSGGEVGGGLGGLIPSQRGSGVTSNVQRMAPGPSVISAPGPFDLNLSAPFQIPGVEVSMQSQWSHVPGPPLHTVPISGPLMGFAMPSRHPRGPNHIGHIPHMMETTSGFNLVPASNPVSSGLFQSVDPAAQFPDELGLGDSSSSVTNTSSSFRGQRPSNRVQPVSSSIVTPTGAAGVGVNSNKLKSGRRASRVTRGGSSLGGGGNGGGSISNAGIGPSSGASGQVANGSRAPSPHLHSPSQMPPISLGQHSHSNPYSDQRGSPQQGIPRVGISGGGWSGQGRKGGGPGRPPVSERGSSGDKNTVLSSSKLKQVYVVKPSSSPRRNIGDASSNLFSGSEVGQTAVGH